MKRTLLLALPILLSILCSCSKDQNPEKEPATQATSLSGNPDEPGWVSKGGSAFDDNMKTAIYGVGIVANIKNAGLALTEVKSRAREDIANNLGVFISGLRERYLSSISDLVDDSKAVEEQLVRQTGKEFVTQQLHGVTIISTWRDPTTNSFYALAKMSFDSQALADKFKTAIKPVITSLLGNEKQAAGEIPNAKGLESDETKSGKISAQTGGSVRLQDGAHLDIPADSLSNDVEIILKRLKLQGLDAEMSALYQLDATSATMKTPARISFPFDNKNLPADKSKAKVRVALQVGDNEWKEVPADVDLNNGIVSTDVPHFSTFIWRIFWFKQWSGETFRNADPVILPVPYYYQGTSRVCWAVSSQMLLKNYGVDMEIWRILEYFKSDSQTGFSAFEFMIGDLERFFIKQHCKVERTLLGWVNAEDFTDYVVYNVRQGRPVWIALKGADHVSLVTGYDNNKIYMNDPSGQMIERLLGPSHVDTKHLNPIALTLAEWADLLSKNVSPLWPRLSLVVYDRAPSNLKPVTMSLLDNSVQFRIPKLPNTTVTLENQLKWDGTKPGGYVLDGVPPAIYGWPDNNPGNSDTLCKFQVNLANSGSAPVDNASLKLYVDTELIRESKGLKIPGRTSNVEVDIMQDAPYEFKDHILEPGDHYLKIILSVGSEEVDSSVIYFKMSPAQPKGVKISRKGDSVKVTWDENPESVKGLCKITYYIWKDNGSKPEAVSEKTEWEGILPPNDTEEHYFQVEAVATPSLTSILSYRSNVGKMPNVVVSMALRQESYLGNETIVDCDAVGEFTIDSKIPTTIYPSDKIELVLTGTVVGGEKNQKDFWFESTILPEGLIGGKGGVGIGEFVDDTYHKDGKFKFEFTVPKDPTKISFAIVVGTSKLDKDHEVVRYEYVFNRLSPNEFFYELKEPVIKASWPAKIDGHNGAEYESMEGYPKTTENGVTARYFRGKKKGGWLWHDLQITTTKKNE